MPGTESLLAKLRSVKHRAYLRSRPLRLAYYDLTEPAVQAWRGRLPYRYDPSDFSALPFMGHDEPEIGAPLAPVPRRIVTFWNGSNAMSANRQLGMRSLRELNPGVEVLLITPENRDEWVLPEAPLHPAFTLLHDVHQADYLRCYFLHFHGGGYADIKLFRRPWESAFDALEASDAWVAGYPNPVRWMTPNFSDPTLQKLMVSTSYLRLGQCAYISRPGSRLTAEWWRELNAILDRSADDLRAHPGDERGSDPMYPLAWNAILAQVLDPLTLKYSDKVMRDRTLMPDLKADYL